VSKSFDRRKIWFKVGKEEFIDHGISGLNIERLSRRANVAKSSFYHFFKSKDDYLNQLIDHWIDEGTRAIVERFAVIDDPHDRLRKLVHYVFTNNVENELFLFQLKSLARTNKRIRKIIDQVEQERVSFIKNILRDMGLSDKTATTRSLFLYIYFVGRVEFEKFNPKAVDKIEQELDELKFLFNE
jgi:AcrR family transcriptional regulator